MSLLSPIVFAAIAPVLALPHVPSLDIERTVATGVSRLLREAGSEATVHVAGRIVDQPVPAGEVTIELGQVAGPLPRSRTAVPVRLLVDGRLVRTLNVWVEMQDVKQVALYATSHPSAHPGERVELAYGTFDMACCPGAAPVHSAEELAGMRSRVALSAGRPALLSDFEPTPAVQARQRVQIEVVAGSVRLVAGGVALGDGDIGDQVTVRPDHARETLRSRVVSSEAVVVE